MTYCRRLLQKRRCCLLTLISVKILKNDRSQMHFLHPSTLDEDPVQIRDAKTYPIVPAKTAGRLSPFEADAVCSLASQPVLRERSPSFRLENRSATLGGSRRIYVETRGNVPSVIRPRPTRSRPASTQKPSSLLSRGWTTVFLSTRSIGRLV